MNYSDEELNKREKELEVYLKCLQTYPLNHVIIKEKTLIMKNDGDEHNDWWFESKTINDVLDFILHARNHYVDGKIWNNGIFGSRWADTTVNGMNVRIAFYSRKNDPEMFSSLGQNGIGKDYAIMVIP